MRKNNRRIGSSLPCRQSLAFSAGDKGSKGGYSRTHLFLSQIQMNIKQRKSL